MGVSSRFVWLVSLIVGVWLVWVFSVVVVDLGMVMMMCSWVGLNSVSSGWLGRVMLFGIMVMLVMMLL